MTDKELKLAIQQAIIAFSKSPVYKASIGLFKTLGYNTERQNPLLHKSYDDFKDSFLGTDSPFNEEKACVKEWKSIDLLFQLTADEVSRQSSLFNTKQVDNTIIETYLFFSIELSKAEYNRTQLAQITREINKVFPMPVLIVFKHGESITLSVINRRLNKKDAQKDVLEKVTVIKDISTTSPHRAHIEILFDLSFSELQRVHKFTNFVELHNAWQKTLDTKELNKRFYRDLSNWYFWALQEVHFPTTNWAADKNSLFKEEEKTKEHNAKNLIRLLTRLLFVWFVKEKNLVPDELFDESYIKDNLLNGFEPRKKKGFDHKTLGSKYYRAILQNLFFATLNQTVGKRDFRKDGQQMNVTNLMRYESYFKDPQAFIKLVEDIVPFMNGGLFECLDSPDPVLKGKKGGDVIIYEDGFSDRKDNTLCVPDYIFFGTGEQADLSIELGNKKQKDVTVNGLINILKSYKFTVTENTPIEEDIALDPELLGRVFENLLASYNPETKTTARKQTGSFYTPREIVNYMVDESLKAYLKQKLESEAGMKPEDAEVGLEFLVGYNEKIHLFDDKQTAVLINAIDNCKILDPACGSGAFPMGILHKLVHILHKLDPNNKLWKERQIEKAQAIDDSEIRDKLIEDIETSFESNELDYGRKLYLIENCIYGVDIQPIATQISKLRFFISLIVDQKTDKSKDNFGIRPLPNLETKFVAANTLIGIEKPKQQASLFDNPKVQALENKLKDIRHRLFSAKTPMTKRKLREEDQLIREEMGALLVQSGWGNESAHQLASWDPYNQNVSSGWFDPEWMFGIADGFDVVIGNPPYIKEYTDKSVFDGLRESEYYQGKMDLWYLFGCKSIDFLRENGNTSFIATNNWITNEGASKFRNKVLNDTAIKLFIDFRDFMIFDSASIQTMVYLLEKNKLSNYSVDYRRVSLEKCTREIAYELLSKTGEHEYRKFELLASNFIDKRITFVKESNDIILDKIKSKENFKLDERKEVAQGIVAPQDFLNQKSAEVLNNKIPVGSGIFNLTNDEVNKLNLLPNELKLIKPFYTTEQLCRYYGNISNKLWVIYTDSSFKNQKAITPYPNLKKHLDLYSDIITSDNKPYGLHRSREEFFFKGEKIISLRKCPDKPIFTYTDFDCYVSQTFFIIKSGRVTLKYLTAFLNSKLIAFWLKNMGKMQGHAYQIDKGPILEIPIYVPDNELEQPIVDLVDQIITSKKNDPLTDTTNYEKQIDDMVYKLYDLTDEEIAIIEGSINGK